MNIMYVVNKCPRFNQPLIIPGEYIAHSSTLQLSIQCQLIIHMQTPPRVVKLYFHQLRARYT